MKSPEDQGYERIPDSFHEAYVLTEELGAHPEKDWFTRVLVKSPNESLYITFDGLTKEDTLLLKQLILRCFLDVRSYGEGE